MKNLLTLLLIVLCSCNIIKERSKDGNLSSRLSDNIQTDTVVDNPIALDTNINFKTIIQVDSNYFKALIAEHPNGKYFMKAENEESHMFEYSSIILSVSYKGKPLIQSQEIESSYFDLILDRMDGVLTLGGEGYTIKKDTLVFSLGLFYPDSDCGYHMLLYITSEGEVSYTYEVASGGLEGNDCLDVYVISDSSGMFKTTYCLKEEISRRSIYYSHDILKRDYNILIGNRCQVFIETQKEDSMLKRILVYDKVDTKLYSTDLINLSNLFDPKGNDIDNSTNSFRIYSLNIENKTVDIEVNENVETLKLVALSDDITFSSQE